MKIKKQADTSYKLTVHFTDDERLIVIHTIDQILRTAVLRTEERQVIMDIYQKINDAFWTG